MWLVGVVCSRIFFFFKQKTAYEMRISDWSSDVCSSDLNAGTALPVRNPFEVLPALGFAAVVAVMVLASRWAIERFGDSGLATLLALIGLYDVDSGIITVGNLPSGALSPHMRSEERRVGNGGGSTGRFGGSPYSQKKKKQPS